MIGVSLPLTILCDEPAGPAQEMLLQGYGGVAPMLKSLRESGITSIELRSVLETTSEQTALNAAKAVIDSGLDMTIHARMYPASPEEFFSTIQPLLPTNVSKPVCLTVHTVRAYGEGNRAKSMEILAGWGMYALKQNIPVMFTLENNRKGKDPLEVTSCQEILSLVEEINLPNVGICWDFGHLYSNHVHYPEHTPNALPSAEFTRRAAHTHIHDCQTRTHFPLFETSSLPLNLYIDYLKELAYGGIYNIELEFERFYKQYDPKTSLEQSIITLKKAINKN